MSDPLAAADDLTMMDVGETCRFFGGASRPLNPGDALQGHQAGKYPAPVKPAPMTSRWVLGQCGRIRKMIAEQRAVAA